MFSRIVKLSLRKIIILSFILCILGCKNSAEVIVSKPFKVITTHYICPDGYSFFKNQKCFKDDGDYLNKEELKAWKTQRLSILVPGSYPVLKSSVIQNGYADLRILYKEKELSIEIRPYKGSRRVFKSSEWFSFSDEEILQSFAIEGIAEEAVSDSLEYNVNFNFIVKDEVVGIFKTIPKD